MGYYAVSSGINPEKHRTLCIRPDLLKTTVFLWVIMQLVVVLTQKNTVLIYFMGEAWNHADLLKFGDQLLMFQRPQCFRNIRNKLAQWYSITF